MSSANHCTLPYAPWQHGAPPLPSVFAAALQSAAKGKGDQESDEVRRCWLPSTQSIWVPAYIAYGLLDVMVPGCDAIVPVVYGGDICVKGLEASKRGKKWLGPQEQEFHEQMLRKLSLHLAAQPGADRESSHAAMPSREPLAIPAPRNEEPGSSQHRAPRAPSPDFTEALASLVDARTCWRSSTECVCVPSYIVYGLLGQGHNDRGGKGGKGSKQDKSRGLQDQDFHQQMLQKLSLHLAAQPDVVHKTPRTEAPQRERLAHHTSLVDGANAPKTVGEAKSGYEKSRWCQDDKTPSPERLHPQILKEGIGGSLCLSAMQNCSAHEDFHQQILRKLALHLAAQPDTMDAQTGGIAHQTPRCTGPSDSKGAWNDRTICEKCKWGQEGKTPSPERLHPQIASSGRGGCLSLNPVQQDSHEQEFHQHILQKLALQLSAPPGTEQEYPEATPDEPQTLLNPTFHFEKPGPTQNRAARAPSPDFADALACLVGDTSRDHKRCWLPNATHVATPSRPGTAGKAQCRGGGEGASLSSNPMQNSSEQQKFHQQMLRQVAQHLAAQPRPRHKQSLSEGEEPQADLFLSDPAKVGEDKLHCDRLIAELEPSLDAGRDRQVMEWILLVSPMLSLTQSGSRVVQRAIEMASAEQLQQLTEQLLQATTALYSSAHGNHVLVRLIEVLPQSRLVCIGETMRGKATTVARHQYGCRILSRLVEYCLEDQIGFLLDELLEDLEALARHQFGNFVVQHLLAHSTSVRNRACVQRLLPHVLQHATHKTASNVVQRMLEHADLSGQAAIADAFLAGEGDTSLESIAGTRYGSFVVQRLVDRLHPRIDTVKARVKAAHPQLQESGFSQRKIVDFLGEAFFRD